MFLGNLRERELPLDTKSFAPVAKINLRPPNCCKIFWAILVSSKIDNILFEEGVELSQEAKEKIYDILFDMDKDIRDGLK